jgi:hypothetical protein
VHEVGFKNKFKCITSQTLIFLVFSSCANSLSDLALVETEKQADTSFASSLVTLQFSNGILGNESIDPLLTDLPSSMDKTTWPGSINHLFKSDSNFRSQGYRIYVFSSGQKKWIYDKSFTESILTSIDHTQDTFTDLILDFSNLDSESDILLLQLNISDSHTTFLVLGITPITESITYDYTEDNTLKTEYTQAVQMLAIENSAFVIQDTLMTKESFLTTFRRSLKHGFTQPKASNVSDVKDMLELGEPLNSLEIDPLTGSRPSLADSFNIIFSQSPIYFDALTVQNIFTDLSIQSGWGYSIGGTTTLPIPLGLVLQIKNKSGATDTLAQLNPTFTFPKLVPDGNTYAVSIHTLPENLRCTLANESGLIDQKSISNIELSCISFSRDEYTDFPALSSSLFSSFNQISLILDGAVLMNTHTWTQLADSPGAYVLSTEPKNNLLYAFISEVFGNDFGSYNILLDTWNDLPNPPGNLNQAPKLLYPGTGDYLYALQGYDSNAFWRFDTTNNLWSNLANTPSLYKEGALAYPKTGDFIYALNGEGLFWKYSISNNTWSTLTSPPESVYKNIGLIYPGEGNYLISMAGSSLRKYDLTTDTWDFLSDARSLVGGDGTGMTSANSLDYLYVISNYDDKDFLRYNYASNHWDKLFSLPERTSFSAPMAHSSNGQYIYTILQTSLNISQLWRGEITGNYVSSGDFISEWISIGDRATPIQLSWVGTVPEGTSLFFQLRSTTSSNPIEEGITTAEWYGPNGLANCDTQDESYTEAGTINPIHDSDNYIQYRACFKTTVLNTTPKLTSVTITTETIGNVQPPPELGPPPNL